MEHVFCHPLAGVLSAYGMGLADQIAMREAALERALDDEGVAEARVLAARLTGEAGKELEIQGVTAERVRSVARVYVRYQGTDTALACELPPADSRAAGSGPADLRTQFERAYRRRFAFLMPHLGLVIESVSVECIGAAARRKPRRKPRRQPWRRSRWPPGRRRARGRRRDSHVLFGGSPAGRLAFCAFGYRRQPQTRRLS